LNRVLAIESTKGTFVVWLAAVKPLKILPRNVAGKTPKGWDDKMEREEKDAQKEEGNGLKERCKKWIGRKM
jgi:hypothetical protein